MFNYIKKINKVYNAVFVRKIDWLGFTYKSVNLIEELEEKISELNNKCDYLVKYLNIEYSEKTIKGFKKIKK